MPENTTNKSIDWGALAYILGGVGPEIAGPGTFAAGAGPPVQQMARAKKYREMVKELLGTEEGKFSTDGKSFSLKAPMSALEEAGGGFDPLARTKAGGGMPAPKQQLPGGAPTGGAGAGIDRSALMDLFLNPSASPLDIGNAGLAGLTTEDISSALGMKVAFEKLRISETAAETPEKTALRKNYEFARQQGFAGSIIDFKNIAETTHQKDYKQAVKGGYEGDFQTWMSEMARAGGIQLSLGDYTARRKASKEVDRADFLMTPKFRISAEKIVDDRRRYEYEGADDPAKTRLKFVKEEMDKQIKTSYPGAVFGEDTKTGIRGWYDKEGKLIASWQ